MEERVKDGREAYEFDFSGEHLCLDFANTLSDRLLERPREHLETYGALLDWGLQAKIIDERQRESLQEVAGRESEEARRVLERAIELREFIARIFLAQAKGEQASEEDVQGLKNFYAEAIDESRLVAGREQGEPYHWEWGVGAERLDSLLWRISKEAVDLLTTKEVASVRVCAADDCNWLFLDTSKNHSRRWCDMKTCGNRAKVRKFYGKKKQEFV